LGVVAGPTPAPLSKVQNQYRFQVMLRTQHIMQVVESLNQVLASLKPPDDVSVAVDVDPISLL
jgi:primosomal protein N' (replication factor Y)